MPSIKSSSRSHCPGRVQRLMILHPTSLQKRKVGCNISKHLGVKLGWVSYGPTFKDKVIMESENVRSDNGRHSRVSA